tara:strand:+ start:285 stop:527 length:243 start_codon:yes stop_codon:yes gene_type:complete
MRFGIIHDTKKNTFLSDKFSLIKRNVGTRKIDIGKKRSHELKKCAPKKALWFSCADIILPKKSFLIDSLKKFSCPELIRI